MAVIERCGTCAFGIESDYHRTFQCHRHAPTVHIATVGWEAIGAALPGEIQAMKEIKGPETVWPDVQPTDFCGEWELKG